MPNVGLSASLLASIAGAIVLGTAGRAALPVLSVIPSVVSFLYNTSTKKSEGDADARNQDAESPPAEEASAPPAKLTPENMCHLLALTHPDMTAVELRKSAAGAPEYRELHLQSSADDARWTPAVDGGAGLDGWRPAVNFFKMDFNPPLTDVIPESGTRYLAYAPIPANPNNPNEAAELVKPDSRDAGSFVWEGREYQYKVAPSLPCLSPSS